MAVYIELTTEPFANVFNAQTQTSASSLRAGTDRARRPLRGLEIKSDTYSLIKLIRSDGTELPLIDSGAVGGTNTQNTNFILQSVTEARMEKHQIVETFGESYIFFFGESPRFLDVTAVLINSFDFNWEAEWWQNYDQYLRGSKSVEMGARTYLFYDDNVVEGYMLMASARKTSDQPLMVQLTFRMFITDYQNISLIGDDNYPIRASVNLPPDVSLTTADAFSLGQAAVGAATNASLQEALQIQAQNGALQQLSGFGGGSDLTNALSSGVQLSSDPFVLGVEQNALEALGSAVGNPPRVLPVRGLISDNTDEFTALIPPDPGEDDPSTSEAPDLSMTAIQQVALYGGSMNDPDTFGSMGLGPNFGLGAGIGIGIGVGSGAFVGASFGVGAGVGLSNVYGGINGGLGFTGGSGFASSASLAIGQPAVLSQSQASTAIAAAVANFGNGVQLSGGIYAGTGVAGGLPGGYGVSTYAEFTGGTSFQAQQATSMGYGANISGVGASINVGGAPSAFAMVVSPGTLTTTPSDVISFNTGDDGESSDFNSTGITID